MIEYTSESAAKLLKQYEMLFKSLKFISDVDQRRDVCYQMSKILQGFLDITNIGYENKYLKTLNKSVYLMDEEKNRLLELIGLVTERRAYINNKIVNNEEITGISIESSLIMGEDKLEEYKTQVKIIDRYKNNIKLEGVLKEEIQVLDNNIKRANDKISNNKNINRQLEERMIRILDKAFNSLGINELLEREKEIELAYTELGYSLEVAKENAKTARRDCSDEIIIECDNMLSSITLEYERYKEKKMMLNLYNIYRNKVDGYVELLAKREEMNNILSNMTGSELYSLVGNELSKEYATIKLESQDVLTLKSLMDEKELKLQTLKNIDEENNGDRVKGLLSNLLENEKRYQEKLLLEKKRREEEKRERERLEEIKRKEEMARRQKALEEERKKEIEERTKQLLVEKKNPVLMTTNPGDIRMAKRVEGSKQVLGKAVVKREEVKPNLIQKKYNDNVEEKEEKKGIPVIKNNEVLESKQAKREEKNIFPELSLDKKDNIFPELTDIQKGTSFFDKNELDDLNDYFDDDKKGWF